jgi:hypothetical protein
MKRKHNNIQVADGTESTCKAVEKSRTDCERIVDFGVVTSALNGREYFHVSAFPKFA